MYAVTAHDDDVQYGINEYVCDTVDDLILLPHCAAVSSSLFGEGIFFCFHTKFYHSAPAGVARTNRQPKSKNRFRNFCPKGQD